jgi:hypothetical protein
MPFIMPALLAIANVFGISIFRLLMYAGIIIAIVTGALTIRHHYVKIGYHKAIADVKKQDNIAIDAARKVEQRAAKCDETNGFWDVITQDCKLGDDK